MFSGGGGSQTETVDPSRAKENEDLKVFSLGVLNTANGVWTKIFNEQIGAEYRKSTFVTFSDQTISEGGGTSGATGPFYCPGDEKVYIDLSFFHVLVSWFN